MYFILLLYTVCVCVICINRLQLMCKGIAARTNETRTILICAYTSVVLHYCKLHTHMHLRVTLSISLASVKEV